MARTRMLSTGVAVIGMGLASLTTGCGKSPAPTDTHVKKSGSSPKSESEGKAAAIPSSGAEDVGKSAGNVGGTAEPAGERAEVRAARAAFEKLIKAEREEDPENWMSADRELMALGKHAAGALAEGLSSPDRRTREFAAMLLARLGPDAATAEPEMVKALGDETPVVRANVAASLSLLGAKPDVVVPVLQKLLAEGNLTVRKIAIYSLGNYGSHADSAVPSLVDFLADESSELKLAAAVTLGNIGPGAQTALAQLEKLKQEEGEEIPAAARESIARINAPADSKSATASAPPSFKTFTAETAAFAVPATSGSSRDARPKLDEPAEAEIDESPSPARPIGDDAEPSTPAGGPSLTAPRLEPPRISSQK